MAASGRGGRVRDLFFLFVVFIFVGLGWGEVTKRGGEAVAHV